MKTLKEFYQAYAAWLDAGAPSLEPFNRSSGLCANIVIFTDEPRELLREMKSQFKAAGLDSGYPFGCEGVYYMQCRNATQHLNPERIEWVRKHAAD